MLGGIWSALRGEGDDMLVEVELLGDVGVRYHADVRVIGSHPTRVVDVCPDARGVMVSTGVRGWLTWSCCVT